MNDLYEAVRHLLIVFNTIDSDQPPPHREALLGLEKAYSDASAEREKLRKAFDDLQVEYDRLGAAYGALKRTSIERGEKIKKLEAERPN